jgi:dienelactone hydrolase
MGRVFHRHNVPSFIGKSVRPKEVPEMQAQAATYNKDRTLMRARAKSDFDVPPQSLMVDPERIAMVGYCFGAPSPSSSREQAYRWAALSAMHVSFRDHVLEAAKNIKGRFLILHGAEDPIAPLEEVYKLIKDFRTAQVEWQMEVYSRTEHGFSALKNTAEQRANTLSQAARARLFSDIFGN